MSGRFSRQHSLNVVTKPFSNRYKTFPSLAPCRTNNSPTPSAQPLTNALGKQASAKQTASVMAQATPDCSQNRALCGQDRSQGAPGHNAKNPTAGMPASSYSDSFPRSWNQSHHHKDAGGNKNQLFPPARPTPNSAHPTINNGRLIASFIPRSVLYKSIQVGQTDCLPRCRRHVVRRRRALGMAAAQGNSARRPRQCPDRKGRPRAFLPADLAIPGDMPDRQLVRVGGRRRPEEAALPDPPPRWLAHSLRVDRTAARAG